MGCICHFCRGTDENFRVVCESGGEIIVLVVCKSCRRVISVIRRKKKRA